MSSDELRPFGDLFALPLRNGLTRPKAVRGAGTKMVSMGELFAHSRIENAPMDRVPLDGIDRERSLLSAGDLLFARQSLVLEGAGKCSIFVGDVEPVTFESHVIRARLNRDVADPDFYYYYFTSPGGRASMRSIVEQVAAAGVRGRDLARLPVPVPPLPRQRAAARILRMLDDRIELNRRMDRTLESVARAVFKSWFVDFDPVRKKLRGGDIGLAPDIAPLFPDSFDGSELRGLPEGWERGTLADVATLNPEARTKPTPAGSINYVDLSSTKWGRIESVTTYAMDDAPSRAQRVLRSGDTIVGTVRPGNGSYTLVAEEELVGSTAFAVLRPTSSTYAPYVYLAATASENIEALSRLADGGAYPAVRPEAVAAMAIVRPNHEVLAAFSRVVGPLLEKLARNERQSRTVATLRDSLIPGLISREVPVSGGNPPNPGVGA